MTPDLFHGFFDDAAVFPPGLAPLDRAVHNHVRLKGNRVTSPFIGPLVLPIDKAEIADSYSDGNEVEISLVAHVDTLASADALIQNLGQQNRSSRIVALEAKLGDAIQLGIQACADFASRHPQVNVSIELPFAAVDSASLSELAKHGFNLKFRAGGIKKELFPTPEQLLKVIELSLAGKVQFKLTAGLHRAIRYTDAETGFDHFGFLNIAAAVAALSDNEGPARALEWLNSDDTESVSSFVSTNTAWRHWFRSFGTCSTLEPAETLVELGLFDQATLDQFKQGE